MRIRVAYGEIDIDRSTRRGYVFECDQLVQLGDRVVVKSTKVLGPPSICTVLGVEDAICKNYPGAVRKISHVLPPSPAVVIRFLP